jgi:dCMP deaminase
MAKMNIKSLRKNLGLTQEELAEKCGVAFATVNRWEMGRFKPSKLAMKTLRELKPIKIKKEKIMRPNWTEYFMNVVSSIAERSTCDRGKPGCVLVKDNQILATGYAGAPPNFPHCDEVDHDMEERTRYIPVTAYNAAIACYKSPAQKHQLGFFLNKEKERYEGMPSQHCVRTVHAEANAILQAARRGIALEGATCYVTMTPCRNCAMMLISVGVVEVIAKKLYQKAEESIEMFRVAGIKITHLDQTVQEYSSKEQVSPV